MGVKDLKELSTFDLLIMPIEIYVSLSIICALILRDLLGEDNVKM